MMARTCVSVSCQSKGNHTGGRRGTIISLLAFTIAVLLGFLALAIDIGMLAIAKTQAQNNADLAALTAARTLNGNSTLSYNSAAATANAQAILSYNNILGQQLQSSQLTLTYGSYDYNQTTQAFIANFPPTTGVPWTAVAATVTSNSLPGAFSNVFGSQFLPNVTGTAQAVHRPRDIALVMDLSGSMRFGTLLGFDFYTATRTTNNPDTLIPAFGQYATISSQIIGPSSNRTSGSDNYTLTPTNTTASNSSYALTYINSFYQSAAYASTLVRAFDSYTSTDGGNTWTAPATGATPQLPPASYATTPGGDVPLFQSGSTTTYAQTVNQVLGLSSGNTTPSPMWCLDGYAAYSAGQPDTSGTGSVPKVWTQTDYSATPFNGYTKGPGYWGKTFFLWPPDPRNANALSGAALTGWLAALGVNTADQTTLSSMWSTWQAQGVGPGSTGLTNLQNWLTGTAKGGASALPTFSGYYTPTSTTAVVPSLNMTKWNGTTLTSANAPRTYYAVCRLFNWAYPAGSTWTGTTLSSGASFSADWRVRFFGTNNNSVVFNSSGSLNPPGSSGMCSATTTYNAILSWVTTTTDPFPPQFRSGRVKYYGSIPTAITGSWPSYGSTDQRFWVEFMDHVLGFIQTSGGNYQDLSGINSSNQMIGYGNDFTWGSVQIKTSPVSTNPPMYMNYNDNPARPLLRHWFSPILMVDYLHNMNMSETGVGNYFVMQPGNSYEAPLYTSKQAFVAAVNTMQTNHPNDWFTIVPYSWPRTSPSSVGRLNCVSCPLGTNYNYAISALLFPFSTINADGSANSTEVTPYDADPSTGAIPSANFVDCGRGDGDTCFAMGLMLAYNQFAVTPSTDTTLRTFVSNSPITFPTGMAGGMGRNGAQKVIIFETDGMANCQANANLVTNGSYNYYKIRYDMNNPSSSEYPSITTTATNNSTTLSQVYSLVQQLASTYGTTRNPFRLYAIGFGPVFQGTDATSALTTLQTMQYNAGTQSNASTALPSNQIITGTDAQMSANMISAYTSILQNGVQIALIK